MDYFYPHHAIFSDALSTYLACLKQIILSLNYMVWTTHNDKEFFISHSCTLFWSVVSVCPLLECYLTCILLNRVQIALSSSSALVRTSPSMAFSNTMTSRADVCSSFTAYREKEVSTRCIHLSALHSGAVLFDPDVGPAASRTFIVQLCLINDMHYFLQNIHTLPVKSF